MTDEGLKAIADTDGVVAITTVFTLVGGAEGYTIEGGMVHIRHAVRLIGAEHVGVSSDRGLTWAGFPPELLRAVKPAKLVPFEQAPRYPGGWGKINFTYRETWDASTQPHALKPCVWPYNVTLPLVMEGYSDDQIRHILGGNVNSYQPIPAGVVTQSGEKHYASSFHRGHCFGNHPYVVPFQQSCS